MRSLASSGIRLKVEAQAAHIAAGAAVATILLLASLHVLSPEFAPSWRMVSEYAFGQYGWVLSVFDVTHDTGHSIAGLLGVGGFPIAALLLSVGLGQAEEWRGARKMLLWIANLSWISVVLLVATLVLMTTQLTPANGGHLPQHAPKSLPPGVFGLDGWANRLVVLSGCLWVFVAAWQAIKLRRKHVSQLSV